MSERDGAGDGRGWACLVWLLMVVR
jgi:hypothetical protein